MKTPDEIKKMLEKCPNADCSLCQSRFYCDIEAEALEYIQQLEARIDTLNAKAVLFDEAVAAGEKMKRERDAAVEQLQTGSRPCSSCKYGDEIVEDDTVCKECKIVMRNGVLYYDHWQWRGVQEGE